MPLIHLDTDFGGDIDDFCALAMVLAWPEAELAGVTTILDDRGVRAGYARYALDLAGRRDVPVAAGADRRLGCFVVEAEGGPLVPDEAAYWPEPVAPLPGPLDEALDLLEQSIAHGALIAAIGGFTNLALLERRTPGILREASIWAMGGYIYPPRAGYPQWGAEMDWNAQVDAASTLAVLQSTTLTLVPMAVTLETYLRRAHLPRLRQGGPLARLLARQAEAFARDEGYEQKLGQAYAGLPDDFINWQHDPLTCALALGWREGVQIETVNVQSQLANGQLQQRIICDGLPTRLVTGVDGDRLSELWVDLAEMI